MAAPPPLAATSRLQVVRARTVCKLLGLRRDTVYKAMKNGTFPGAYIEGNSWRVPLVDIEAYQEARRAATPAALQAREAATSRAQAVPPRAPGVCPVCGLTPGLVGGRLALHGPDPDGGPACAGSRYSVEAAAEVAARRARRTA